MLGWRKDMANRLSSTCSKWVRMFFWSTMLVAYSSCCPWLDLKRRINTSCSKEKSKRLSRIWRSISTSSCICFWPPPDIFCAIWLASWSILRAAFFWAFWAFLVGFSFLFEPSCCSFCCSCFFASAWSFWIERSSINVSGIAVGFVSSLFFLRSCSSSSASLLNALLIMSWFSEVFSAASFSDKLRCFSPKASSSFWICLAFSLT